MTGYPPVRRRLAGLTLVAALLAPLATAVAPPEDAGEVRQAFDLYAGGIPVGEAVLTAEIGDGAYRIDGAIRTAGLVRPFFDASLTAEVAGAIEDGAMLPRRFAASTVNEDEVDQIRIDYADGAPRVVRGEPPIRPRPYSLDPVRQGRVADPLTAALSALAPRRAGFCDRRIESFDGKRRFAIAIGPPEPDGTRLRCAARYERIAGYKPKMMRPDRRTIPFTIWFEENVAGRHEPVRAVIPAGWIEVSLVRRD